MAAGDLELIHIARQVQVAEFGFQQLSAESPQLLCLFRSSESGSLEAWHIGTALLFFARL